MDAKLTTMKDCQDIEHANLKVSMDTKRQNVDPANSSCGSGSAEREGWASKAEFTLSCIGYAVGLGNLWRFPYLCMRNGGGAFLIPYITILTICGLPMFFMEMVLGQFCSRGPINLWKMMPISRGIGWSMVLVSIILTIYYNTIIGWSIYYLVISFGNDVPWRTCHNWWNTDRCIDTHNVTLNATTGANVTVSGFSNATDVFPAEEYWRYRALALSDGIHDLGGIKWDMCLCVLGAWVLLFLCVCRGVKSVGKVVYVTALLPYVLLFVLLIRGVTLEGSLQGIKYYLIPDWNQVLHFKVWTEACLQVFFSLGPAIGGTITMASYNSFHRNCLFDAVVTVVVCGLTSLFAGFVLFSVIGHMAHTANLTISEVVTQGPGLAFIVYPEAISLLPVAPLWAILFFLMLITLGLDSQFVNFEVVLTGLVDRFPKQLSRHRTAFVAATTSLFFLLSLPFVSRGGMYVFQLFDWYATTFSLVIIGLSECVTVSFVYGIGRFYYDAEMMFGRRISYFWAVCWAGITPLILLVILLVTSVNIRPPTYGDYVYPWWANLVGWLLALVPTASIPAMAMYSLCARTGSIKERLCSAVHISEEWGPSESSKQDYYFSPKDNSWINRVKFHRVHETPGDDDTDKRETTEGLLPMKDITV